MPQGRFQIPDEAIAYTEALRTLIHTGIGPWLPTDDNALIKFFNNDVATDGIAQRSRVRSKLIEHLQNIVDTELEGEDRERVKALLGFSPWLNEPLARRQHFVGSSYPSASRNWEGVRKEPLDRYLLSLFIFLMDRRYGRDDEQMNPLSNESGYEFVQYYTRADPEAGETVQRRTLRAVQDDVTFCEIQTYRYGPATEEVVLLGPGTLSQHSKGVMHHANIPGQSYFLRIDFPKPLMRGEEFEFTLLRRDLAGSEQNMTPGWYDERHVTPRLPVRRATFEVRFPAASRPAGGVWAFEGRADWLVPGTLAAGIPLPIGEDGIARYSWRNPTLNRACGIAWEW